MPETTVVPAEPKVAPSFEIDEVVSQSPASASKGGFEKQDDRDSRMKAFLNSEDRFLKVGRLMGKSHNGQVIAEIVLDGGSVDLPTSIKLNGQVYPLKPGQTLSLETIDSWGCPACRSQHGTGVRPSPRVNPVALAQVDFYYAPKSQLIFSVSASCWGQYVKGLGFVKKFVTPKVKQ